jgi:hypothetical protein
VYAANNVRLVGCYSVLCFPVIRVDASGGLFVVFIERVTQISSLEMP